MKRYPRGAAVLLIVFLAFQIVPVSAYATPTTPTYYYLAQWEWIAQKDEQEKIIEEYWQAPHEDKLLGLVDLRSLPAQGKRGGIPEGYGFFSYFEPVSIPNSIYLGNSLTNTLSSEQKARMAEILNIQESIKPNTVVDVLWDVLTTHADPTGKDRVKPLRGKQGKLVQLHLGGHSVIKEQSFTAEHIQRTIAVFQADYRRNKQSNEYSLATLQKWTGATMLETYGVMTDELAQQILPAGYKKDGWREPETTITENFNTANSSTLGPTLSWTEADGDWSIVSNELNLVTANGSVVKNARADTDLSTDDHYAQIDVTAISAGNFSAGGAAARFNSSSATFYFAHIRLNGGSEGWELKKLVGGVETVIDSATVTFSAPDTVKISVSGSTQTATLNADNTLSGTDTAISGNLRTGVTGYSSGGASRLKMDNFEASDLAIASTGGSPSPSIGSIQVTSLTDTSAIVSWYTSKPATTQLVGFLAPPEDTIATTYHTVALTNLTPHTSYSYTILARKPGFSSTGTALFSFITREAEPTISSGIEETVEEEPSVEIQTLQTRVRDLQIQIIGLLEKLVKMLQEKLK